MKKTISGIRGIVDLSLTNAVFTRHIKAFSLIQGAGSILIARDSRTHGASFINIGCATLSSSGRNTLNYGIIPTPTAQFLIEKNGLAGGVVITASHNPADWNGIKFIDSNGCFLSAEKNRRLYKIADSNPQYKTKLGNIINIDSGYKSHIDHTRNL